MSSKEQNVLNKDNLDFYLKEVAKEYRKINGKKMRAEIILVGGASIIANYGFREMTTDIDACLFAASTMKEAINRVGDKYGLPNGWLNENFKKTSSYTNKIIDFSEYYRTYSNIVEIRTVSAEYLIAMKLKSGREYKNDLSDIAGILNEQEKNGSPIIMQDINRAVENLYGGWDEFPSIAVEYIENLMAHGNYEDVYKERKKQEINTKETLINFEEKYQGVLNQNNINDIIATLEKKAQQSVPLMDKIQNAKSESACNDTSEKETMKKDDTYFRV